MSISQHPHLTGEREFKQWLYAAALFKVSERRRRWLADKRIVPRQALPEADTSQLDALFLSLSTPSEAAALRERMERLRSAFGRLSEEQRRIILLARLEGLPHREIAARLGVSEGNSRVLLARALAHLARLADEEPA